MLSKFVVVLAFASALVSTMAFADGPGLTCVEGQFGDHVDHGKAVGDAKSIADAKKVVYVVDMANTGEPTQVTLVWKVDGKEVQRQSLDIGKAPHWHTWGTRPIAGASKIEVQIVDGAGTQLKDDALSL